MLLTFGQCNSKSLGTKASAHNGGVKMDAKALEEWGGKGAVSYQEPSGVHGLIKDFKIKGYT